MQTLEELRTALGRRLIVQSGEQIVGPDHQIDVAGLSAAVNSGALPSELMSMSEQDFIAAGGDLSTENEHVDFHRLILERPMLALRGEAGKLDLVDGRKRGAVLFLNGAAQVIALVIDQSAIERGEIMIHRLAGKTAEKTREKVKAEIDDSSNFSAGVYFHEYAKAASISDPRHGDELKILRFYCDLHGWEFIKRARKRLKSNQKWQNKWETNLLIDVCKNTNPDGELLVRFNIEYESMARRMRQKERTKLGAVAALLGLGESSGLGTIARKTDVDLESDFGLLMATYRQTGETVNFWNALGRVAKEKLAIDKAVATEDLSRRTREGDRMLARALVRSAEITGINFVRYAPRFSELTDVLHWYAQVFHHRRGQQQPIDIAAAEQFLLWDAIFDEGDLSDAGASWRRLMDADAERRLNFRALALAAIGLN